MNRSRATAAASRQDYEDLKCIAKEPGGFVDDETRRRVWPVLLHVDQSRLTDTTASSSSAEAGQSRLHLDAHQVQLDVDRSFNQSGWLQQSTSPAELDQLRTRLSLLTHHVLNAHPALRYFQGLHDIYSVLVLVFPLPEQQPLAQACAVQLSLHHLRDHQTSTLNPSIGYLRLLSALLSHAEPKLAALVEEESGLPFFALSWVITWLSHDVESLPAVKRLFDLLLVMNPAFITYVAAVLAIMQSRSLNMKTIELGELQHFLTQLPRFRPSTRSPDSSNSDSDLEIPSDMSTSFATSASSNSFDRRQQQQRDDPGQAGEASLPQPPPPPPPALDIEEVLSRAQELYRRYPPQSIGLLDIFGPQSTTRTWTLASRLITDEEAEQIVAESKGIVKPEKRNTDGDDDRKKKVRRSTPFWKTTQAIVLVGAVAGVVLAFYGPKLLDQRSRWVKPWMHAILNKWRGTAAAADGRWFLDRLWR